MSSKTPHVALLVAGTAALFAAPVAAQVPSQQGFFGAVDGRWMWLGGDRIESSLGSGTNATNGPGGQVLVGYRFDGRWDVALAGGVQQMLSELTQFRNGRLSVDTNRQHVDLEIGYSTGDWRYSFGLRGVHHLQSVSYNAVPAVGIDQRDIWGLGVKAGIGGRFPLSESLALIGGVDGALVYANFIDFGTGSAIPNGNYWGLIPQLGGELGVSWRSSDAPNFSLAVGGRIDASFNTAMIANGRGTLLDFGPFIRLAYNFGGAPRIRPAAPPADAPAATAPSSMVFFDFDRADITAVAQGTIQRAANDAKAGRVARLQVTGHADRAGSDTYNQALSLRRANAVKTALISNGIPEQQISVIGRGESEPLVPTADGVREPQNRRVVISF